MFDQLKKRVALRQGLTLGLLFLALLGLIFMHNAITFLTYFNENVQELSDSPEQYFFGAKEPPRDTFFVLVRGGEPKSYTNETFYDAEMMDRVVSYALEHPAERGKIVYVGVRIAYAVTQRGADVYIGFFDYSEKERSLRNAALLVGIIAALGLVCIGFYSVDSARRQVAPVENAFKKQKDLVANASHELKTPLTVINADLEILKTYREGLTEEQVKWLDGIAEQTTRMRAMVEEMMELAKLESEDRKIEKVPVDLAEVAKGVVLGTEALAFERAITIEENIADEQFVLGERDNLEKLTYILVENALKYTPDGGKVDVTLSSDRKKIVLTVKNTGEGIKKEDIPKLFDRFYRTDESHHSANGFGLGLAIAKSIADAHDAEITVDSTVGEYTAFSVTFSKYQKK